MTTLVKFWGHESTVGRFKKKDIWKNCESHWRSNQNKNFLQQIFWQKSTFFMEDWQWCDCRFWLDQNLVAAGATHLAGKEFQTLAQPACRHQVTKNTSLTVFPVLSYVLRNKLCTEVTLSLMLLIGHLGVLIIWRSASLPASWDVVKVQLTYILSLTSFTSVIPCILKQNKLVTKNVVWKHLTCYKLDKR